MEHFLDIGPQGARPSGRVSYLCSNVPSLSSILFLVYHQTTRGHGPTSSRLSERIQDKFQLGIPRLQRHQENRMSIITACNKADGDPCRTVSDEPIRSAMVSVMVGTSIWTSQPVVTSSVVDWRMSSSRSALVVVPRVEPSVMTVVIVLVTLTVVTSTSLTTTWIPTPVAFPQSSIVSPFAISSACSSNEEEAKVP